jgi:signal transduction histidine kinase
MKRLRLTPWFRARMLPLVSLTGLIVATSAPAAYYLRERFDLVASARRDAARVGEIVRERIEQQPLLWRYGSAKLAERLASEGFVDKDVRLVDAEGVEVRLDGGGAGAAEPERRLWGRAEVVSGGREAATAWVGVDAGPLLARSAELTILFLALALALAAVLYRLPMRAIAAAERRIASLLGKLALTLQEEDRRRIATDLHDGAGQALTAARLELVALRSRTADPAGLERIAARLDEAIEEVRRSTTALAPPVLSELGLAGAIRRHCEAFADASGLEVICEVQDLPASSPEIETACYRIVQEALTNTARHAGASRAEVLLSASPGGGTAAGRPCLRIEVKDDGGGMELERDEADPRRGGRGIDGIRERVRLLGGEVHLTEARPSGLSVEVMLPMPEAASEEELP